jgi:GWxTD domain-containing protein
MRRSVLVPVVLALGAGALAAQEPGERARLDALRASVQAVSDTVALRRWERERIAAARVERDDPFLHMELGFVAFRLGDLTGWRRRYQDAASEFQWAADLRPGWPMAWYHLGLAELAIGESGIILLENLRQALQLDRLSQAARAFARALEADPSYGVALVDLADIALRQRVAARLAVAQEALRQAAGTPAGRIPSVQRQRGRLERRLGEMDSALVAFRAYLAAGGDSVVAALELARTHAQRGGSDSVAAAWRAALARPPSPEARAEFRGDLRWVATPAELARFDVLPDSAVAPWLERFWEGRGAQDGRRGIERLQEHFRRTQYAVTRFRLVSPRRAYSTLAVFRDTSQADLDDRGVIYIRHGEPTERRQHIAPGTDANETWLYRRTPPAEDLVLNFRAIGDVQDFRLVESLAAICGGVGTTAAGLQRTTAEQTQVWNDCLASRVGLSDLYDRLARAGGDTRRLWAQERLYVTAQAREATTTDSYALHFERELRPVVSYFTVADAAGRPELHLVFAVPADRLHPVPQEGGGALYALALRLLVMDTARAVLATLDTVRVFRSAQPLGAGSYLAEQLQLRVPAGSHRYTLVVQEPHATTGTAAGGQALEVPAVTGAFAASDVVLGREGSGLVWRRAEGDVALNPLMRYPREGTATLYYELYGLPQGAPVGTRVRVLSQGRSVLRRLLGGGGGADLAYTTVTDAPGRMRVRQALALRGLAPGRYVLELELSDPVSGRRVVRRAPFEIEG